MSSPAQSGPMLARGGHCKRPLSGHRPDFASARPNLAHRSHRGRPTMKRSLKGSMPRGADAGDGLTARGSQEVDGVDHLAVDLDPAHMVGARRPAEKPLDGFRIAGDLRGRPPVHQAGEPVVIEGLRRSAWDPL